MEVVGRILVIIGPFLGLTRVVLGVHWPSDVIAGWAFGSAVLLTSALSCGGPSTAAGRHGRVTESGGPHMSQRHRHGAPSRSGPSSSRSPEVGVVAWGV